MLLPLKLFQPKLNKNLFLLLSETDRSRRKLRSRLVRKPAILVPVMDGVVDQEEGLRDGRLAFREPKGMHACSPPRIPLAIDPGKARIAEFEATIFVDGVNVCRLRDIESFAADDGRVL